MLNSTLFIECLKLVVMFAENCTLALKNLCILQSQAEDAGDCVANNLGTPT